MKKIAVIGSNMVDLVTYTDRMPKAGETIEAPLFDMGFGGKGANQAVAAAKLGADVLMVSMVGDDMFGPNTRENFIKLGIDARHVHVVPGVSSGVAPIFVETSGQNSILIIKGANNHLRPANIDSALDDIRQCELILMQLEIPLETVYHVIDLGVKENIPVMLNPAPAVDCLDMKQIAKLSIFVPNETELETITRKPVETVDQITKAAKSLVEEGIRTVIVTMGGKGALLVTRDDATHIPCPTVAVKDTTGAGDAFIGCFSRYYVETKNFSQSITKAVAYASLSTMKPGTQKSFASLAEFELFCTTLLQ